MSEIQVRAKYASRPAKWTLYGLLALIPVWGVFAPVSLVFLIAMMLFQPAPILESPLLYLGFIGGMVLMTTVAVLSCIALADDKLIASKDGIRIPFHASLATKLRRDFPWHEISGVAFTGDINSVTRDFTISFSAKSGLHFAIKSAKLTEAELEQLLLALELWSSEGTLDERFPLIKDQLQQKLAISDAQQGSYTAMWEDELERRFASTAFVVLEPDATLKDGNLKVVRQLSFGGLSAVYLCQMNKRELVVLKESVVPADSSDELRRKAEEMFAREARLLIRLKHPNVVTVLDYFVEKGRNYLLLEHINGQDLKQYVRQHGPQPEYRVKEWARKLAEVLNYLHTQEPPIIHRDISPDNIVLDQNNTIKIIDFGAANEFIGTATGTLIGKQSYLPIEQLRGKAVPQSDIYALGSTLHFLLTGEDPEPLAVSHPRQFRPELSEEIDQLISRCTDSECRNRPQSAAELSSCLWQESEPVS